MLVHLGVIDLSTTPESLGIRGLFAGTEDADRDKLRSLLAAAPERPAGAPKEKVVPTEGPALTVDQSYVLRAAAIDACELIVGAARSLTTSFVTEAVDTSAGGSVIPSKVAPDDGDQSLKNDLDWIKAMTLPDLDMWLWAVAKDRPDYRRLERFVVKDTAYF
jgi:hypothetical protein